MATAMTTGLKTALGNNAIITAGLADFLFEAGDTAGSTFSASGRDLVIIYNSHGANAYTVTIASTVDPYNRAQDVTAYSLAAGEYALFGPLKVQGWASVSTSLITITVENVAVKIAVIRL